MGGRILVAEDHPINQLVTVRMLEDHAPLRTASLGGVSYVSIPAALSLAMCSSESVVGTNGGELAARGRSPAMAVVDGTPRRRARARFSLP